MPIDRPPRVNNRTGTTFSGKRVDGVGRLWITLELMAAYFVNCSNYKSQSTGMKEWYLLSVFLGDVIRDANLCKQLAKRLTCGPDTAEEEASSSSQEQAVYEALVAGSRSGAFVYRN